MQYVKCTNESKAVISLLYSNNFRSQGSLAGIATGYRLDGWGSIPGRGKRIFLFSTVSMLVLGPTEVPIQWVQGALTLGDKAAGA
jgi:hypothetical protein